MKISRKRIVLCGFGNVGRVFAGLVAERREMVELKYGIRLEIVAVVDIGGAVVSANGPLPIGDLLAHVESGSALEAFTPFGEIGMTGKEVLGSVPADVLVDITPTNLTDAEPGRTHFLAAIDNGLDIVTANKAPLVLFYDDILNRANAANCHIYMSAATAAALPTLDVGLLCLAGTEVTGIEGILNGTTNYILTRMHFEKCSYETALKAAQELGIAETDPTLDVEGLDTRNKILVIANQVMEQHFSMTDVSVTGITDITPADIDQARAKDRIIKLVGSAAKASAGVTLKVEPVALEKEHPLAGIHYSEKGISYLSDTMGRITVSGGKSSPQGAAAALLKDLIHSSLFSSR